MILQDIQWFQSVGISLHVRNYCFALYAFLFFTLQQTIFAPFALELGGNKGQIWHPECAADKRCLACIQEGKAFQSLPLVRIGDVVGLKLCWWHSRKPRVNKKVAMPDVNLCHG